MDYFFRYNTEADALADAFAAAQKFQVSGAWARDHVLPNVSAWRVSTGVPFTGWFAIVSLNKQVDALLNAAALQFALDRDGPPYIIRNNIGAAITDVACSPIFAGSHYPIGNYT